MLNYIWAAIIIISVVCSVVTGRIEYVSDAIFSGTKNAIDLLISISGMMALWTGLLKIADKSGITVILSKCFAPILKKIFPEYDNDSPVIKTICMNITANLLGLGNAATPFGIAAMNEMNKTNLNKSIASDSMVTFVVMNTASIQLVPTMLTILRQKHDSASPFEVMPAIWIVSALSLIVGVCFSKLFSKNK